MVDLIESARSILSISEKRMDVAAANVANLTTPGFKSQKLYSETFASFGRENALPSIIGKSDFAQGKLSRTGNPLDLAIAGKGYFRVAGANGPAYTRDGQFHISSEGRVVNAQGLALQQADGEDLILESSDVLITADGSVVRAGQPVAKIGLYAPDGDAALKSISGSMFTIDDQAVKLVDTPDLRQGMVEASNVTLADEMMSVMASLRHAENGARLVQVYDDLMGKAVTTLGQGGR